MNSKRMVLSMVLAALASNAALSQTPTADEQNTILQQAVAIRPSPCQQAWLESGFNAFVHFTVNTFTDREWGEGTEDPKIFNPTDLDARQWVRILQDAGMKRVVLTAKHHDGFCLWPSKYTEHSVKNSPWRGGKGDVVREVADACREFGMEFGLYLSPWDLHENSYGDSPRYNEYYRNQLRELLTQYGQLHEIWLDGANGEGPNGRKQVYDIDGILGMIRTLQPQAAIMGVDGAVRDETGYGRETEWLVAPRFVAPEGSLYEPRNVSLWSAYFCAPDYGSRAFTREGVLKRGYPLDCLLTEDITSIRPGWFYHASEDDKVKSLDTLLDIYYNSVGRSAPLLLNVPPDRRGRIHEIDAQRLHDLGKMLRATFATDLARGATATASQQRDGNTAYSAANTVDGDNHTYWMADDGTETASLEFDLGQEKAFNRIVLQECLARGQRVEEFAIDVWDSQNWSEVAHGTTIGHKRILRIADANAQKVRVRILRSRICPTLATFGLYLAPPVDEILSK